MVYWIAEEVVETCKDKGKREEGIGEKKENTHHHDQLQGTSPAHDMTSALANQPAQRRAKK
jgi:hypothetical protein